MHVVFVNFFSFCHINFVYIDVAISDSVHNMKTVHCSGPGITHI